MVEDVVIEPVVQLSSRLLLAAIVESSDDAILSKDLNGTITSWNRGAERILGYKAEEIIGRSILTLIPEELHSEEREIIRRLKAGERIEHFDTVRLKKNGERVELSLTISPIKDETGRTIGASKVARDISERRRMERVLLQSEKIAATGRMAATIAHEINNPLEAIINLLYLARISSTEPTIRDYLETAEGEVQRVSLIAQQTLGFFRETAAVGQFQAAELMDYTLAVYHRKFAQSGIDVVREFSTVPPIRVRRGEILQVFANLISNAVDAMLEGGTLRLRIAEDRRDERPGVRIDIIDQGTGVPPELQERIFEAFFTTKETRGTGIGLWISRKFVEEYGGTLRVESSMDGPDRGSRFSIFLPH